MSSWFSRSREQSDAPSETSVDSVGSQISCDSVDPTTRVQEEFESLIEEYLDKLQGKAAGKSRLRKIKSRLLGYAQFSEPQIQCIKALEDFQDVLSLWQEYREDVKDQGQKTKKQRRIERAISRLEAIRTQLDLKRVGRLSSQGGHSGLADDTMTARSQLNDSFLVKDQKRQYLVKLYGEMSYFLGKIIIEIQQRGYDANVVEGFLREVSQFERRLLEIILNEGLGVGEAVGSSPFSGQASMMSAASRLPETRLATEQQS